MDEELLSQEAKEKAKAAAEKLAKQREVFAQKLKAKGAQQLTLKQYQELQAKKSQKKKIVIPDYVKIIFSSPFILLACFGIIFIPLVIYQIATSKPAKEKTSLSESSFEDILKKDTGKASSSTTKNP